MSVGCFGYGEIDSWLARSEYEHNRGDEEPEDDIDYEAMAEARESAREHADQYR